MRHIITGGSGFTGAALIRSLAAWKATIVNFDLRPPSDPQLRQAATFIQGDVANPRDLGRLDLGQDEIVYHLAARQFADQVPKTDRDEWFAAVNVEGTRNVLGAMLGRGTRKLVFFSTDMTYGVPTITPVPPEHPLNPLGPYGRSKRAAEQAIRGAREIDVTVFRRRLITGPGRLGILSKLFRLIRLACRCR